MPPPTTVQRIVLTGFMGSGKTTVGRLLAARLGWQFSDLDREVERHTRMTVPLIFAEQGEARFREHEAEVLASLLPRERLVLALGGGAPEFPATTSLLQGAPDTWIAYLAAPFPTLTRRCRVEVGQSGAVHRPLFEDAVEAERRFTRREPLYLALAHATVATNGISAAQVAEAVHRTVLPMLPLA